MHLPLTVYHYCTHKAFLEIISNKILRLNNLFSTSDENERHHIDSIIEEVFKSLNSLEPQCYRQFFFTIIMQHYRMNRKIEPYFISFSEQGDLLRQWHMYGENGGGFAIGFNPFYFGFQQNIPFPSTNPDNTVGIFKVIYEKAIVTHEITKVIMASWGNFKKDRFAENSSAMIPCAGQLVRIASCYKIACYSNEKEWRILYTPWPSGNLEKVKAPIFYNLSFGEIKTISPINNVILGPKNKEKEECILELLTEKGNNNVVVTRSRKCALSLS